MSRKRNSTSKSQTMKNKKKVSTWAGLFFVMATFVFLLLPVIYHEKAMDASLVPRLLALYLFLIACTLFFMRKNILRQLDLAVLRHPVIYVAVALSVVGAISLLFATNVSAGFFDVFKTLAILIFTAYLAMVLVNTEGWMVRLAKFNTLGLFLSLLIGYYEYLQIGVGFHSRHMLVNLTGLMSNVNLYANYLMLLIPLVVFSIITHRGKWRLFSIILLCFALLMLFLLQTRAVYLGLMIGIPASTLLLLKYHDRFDLPVVWRNRLVVFISAGALALIALIVVIPEDHPYLSRARSIFFDAENPRIKTWQVSTHMIADHPFGGIGAGNFPILLQSYYSRVEVENWSTTWMRPHNDYLWVGAEKGLPGLLLYLLYFALAFRLSIQMIKTPKTNDSAGKLRRWLSLLLFFGLVSYSVNAFFDFPLERINHQVMFSLYVAVLLALSYQENPKQDGNSLTPRRGLLMIPLLMLLLVGAYYSFVALRQERFVKITRSANSAGNYDLMLEAAKNARTKWKTLDHLAVPVVYFEGIAYAQKNNHSKAIELFKKAQTHNPYRAYIYRAIAVTFFQAGDHDHAIDYLEQLLEKFPKDHAGRTLFARILIGSGDSDQALQKLKEIPEPEMTQEARELLSSIRKSLARPTPTL